MSEYSHLNPIELAKAYKADGVGPEEDDENRLRIANQGGAMAGIVTLGMLSVLDTEGYLAHVHGIDTISVGAINAAAVMGGITGEALNFYKTAGMAKFIKPYRFWRIVDLRQPVEQLGEKLKPEIVMAHSAELGIGLTDRRTLRPVAKNSREFTEDELLGYVADAIALPLAGGISFREYTDGGTSWLTTPAISLHHKATHIIDLSNYPHKTWKYNKWPTLAVDAYSTLLSGRPWNAGKFTRFALQQEVEINTNQPKNVQTIYPGKRTGMPGTFTTDPETLQRGYEAGQQAAVLALGVQVDRTFSLAA